MKKHLLHSLSLFVLFTISNHLEAQPGKLDSSFGINGKVISNAGADGFGCHEMALKADGGFVAIGNSPIYWTEPNSMIISQFKANGQPDSTFGNNGRVTKVFNFGASIFFPGSVVIQPDGKIVAGGSLFYEFAQPDHYLLMRLLPNGLPDSTFGDSGIVVTYIGPYPQDNYLAKLYLQPDGKILAGGFSNGQCVTRYNTNGVIDSTFAENGMYINRNDKGMVTDIAIQDGRILLGGGTDYFSDLNSNFKITRLLRNGKIDLSFGTNGFVETEFFGGFDQISAIKVLQDGTLLTNGTAYKEAENTSYVVLAKYQRNGKLDSSFGLNGKVISQTTGTFLDYMGSLLIQPDEKILSTGVVSRDEFYLCRYNKDGTPDPSFGINGKAIADFGSSSNSLRAAFADDGKILVGGGPDFRFAKFKGDEPVQISLKKNISVVEGSNGATTPAQFKVILSKQSPTDVFVNYTTHNLTALAGSDYTIALGTLRIKAGKTSGNIIVPVIGDNVREANERFSVVLSNPVNAALGELDSAVCTIKNDDAMFAVNSSQEGLLTLDKSVTIYPNPVHDVLTVQGLNTKSKKKIEIIDINGKVLISSMCNSCIATIRVNALINGIYCIRITTDSQKTNNFKFIKQ